MLVFESSDFEVMYRVLVTGVDPLSVWGEAVVECSSSLGW